MDAAKALIDRGVKSDGKLGLRGAPPANAFFLTTGDDNPNGATVRFLVDGAETSDFSGYDRIVFMFDAADSEALAKAREAWKAARSAGGEATYWRQDENGRWKKQG